MNKIENNQVTICGEIASGFNFNHEFYGEKFYIVDVKMQRTSDNFDIIPVMVSDRLVDVSEDYIGYYIAVNGQFRSYNQRENGKNRLILSVFAREIEFIETADKSNQIYLDGYICKEPKYRETPLGREIADVLLAVNRLYGKSDYIPCICWGRNARYVSGLELGTHVKVSGRIQSRIYIKTLDDGSTEERTAYEVSVNKLEVHEDEE